jgi:RNA recognition motif-containing protein
MNIYIGNLSFNATENDIKSAFEIHGTVETASIIRDKYSGQSKGFGFVEMPNNEEAEKAIQALNGSDFKGRTLKVSEAKPRENRSRQGGFGRNRKY